MSLFRASVVALSLRNYRNFERLDVEVPAEGFVIIGDNGQGKTNLLESVAYLSLLRSTRGARDVDVTRFGADGFYIDARVTTPERRHVGIGFERKSRRKRVRIDDAPVDRLSDALGVLPTVSFSPTDVELIGGAPSARRRYLDVMLALTSRSYLRALQQYRAALERRNAALRDAARRGGSAALAGLEVWEPALASNGAELVRERRGWIAGNAARFAERCAAIGERASLTLRYRASGDPHDDDVAERLAAALAVRRESDVRAGVTQVGPHRDEIAVLLDGRELREFGSAGQQRTAAIALRVLEAETLRAARQASPVFLLDDPFAELDARRSACVLALLGEVGLGQTLLAVPRDTEIPSALTGLPVWRIANGRVQT